MSLYLVMYMMPPPPRFLQLGQAALAHALIASLQDALGSFALMGGHTFFAHALDLLHMHVKQSADISGSPSAILKTTDKSSSITTCPSVYSPTRTRSTGK